MLVDKIVEHERRWSEMHLRYPEAKLLAMLYQCCGHPAQQPQVKREEIELFRYVLDTNGEPKLANIVGELLKKCPQIALKDDDLTAHDIRITMMFILANLELLKEREGWNGKHWRTIDSGWLEE